ncbi:Eco57I restriction-modification methylase domain-containing protein [Halegenticoccus tardaugens]|uniref:Eco57I restriction-modification methylase domain-containing protein n=1 Tax=Halegenticoccus tardaugens TaxID=2071624 RepID=UPI00100B077C|nr:N-6 DNA methylase [Halegenticoccus tardaugens]
MSSDDTTDDWNGPRSARETVGKLAERLADADGSWIGVADELGEAYRDGVPAADRKALGKYYTPQPLVRYVVRRIEPRLDAESVVIDPACGAGAFLAELYAALERRRAAGEPAESAPTPTLPRVHGVDVDESAAALAAANLLVRARGREPAERRTDRPPSAPNVVVGNAIGPSSDSDDGSEPGRSPGALFRRVARERGGYDAVVGNPPYFVAARGSFMPRSEATYGEAIRRNYEVVVRGRANVASLFLKRGLDLLRPNGVLAFVLPKPTLYADGFRALRAHALGRCRVLEVVDVGRAWDDVGYEQIVLVLELEPDRRRRAENLVRVVSGFDDAAALERGEYSAHSVPQTSFDRRAAFPIYRSSASYPTAGRIWDAVWERSIPFGDVDADVFRGLSVRRGSPSLAAEKRGPEWTPMVRGRHVGGRRRDTGESWYLDLDGVEYVDAGDDRFARKAVRLDRDRIVCKRLVSSDVKIDAAYDDSASNPDVPGANYSNETVTNVAVEDDRFDDLFLLGVLTCDLVAAYLRDVVFARATLTMDLDRPYLARVPVPTVPRTADERGGREADGCGVTQRDVRRVVETLAESKAALEAHTAERRGTSAGGIGENEGADRRGGTATADPVLDPAFDEFRRARRELNELLRRAYGVDDADAERLYAG